MTLYDDLGLASTASPDEIRRAYRAAAQRHHPDKGGDADAMARINRAYAVLSDPERRQHYDQTGIEEPQDTRAQAEQWIASCLDNFLAAEHEVVGDLADMLRQKARLNVETAARDIEKQRGFIARVERRRRRLKGTPILERLAADRIRKAEQMIGQIEGAIAVMDSAIALLSEVSDAEAQPEPPAPVFTYGFLNAWGGQ